MTKPHAPMKTQRPDKEHPSELQNLLDRIQCGTIEDVSELDPVDLALLQRYYAGEELADLFDRLRGGDPERN